MITYQCSCGSDHETSKEDTFVRCPICDEHADTVYDLDGKATYANTSGMVLKDFEFEDIKEEYLDEFMFLKSTPM